MAKVAHLLAAVALMLMVQEGKRDTRLTEALCVIVGVKDGDAQEAISHALSSS